MARVLTYITESPYNTDDQYTSCKVKRPKNNNEVEADDIWLIKKTYRVNHFNCLKIKVNN